MIVQVLLYFWATLFVGPKTTTPNQRDACIQLLNGTRFGSSENVRQCYTRVEFRDIFDRLKDVCVLQNGSHPDFTLWHDFKVEFKKDYSSSEEELWRCFSFINSLRLISSHGARFNSSQQSFYFKITEYADLTNEEFRKAYLGPGGSGGVSLSTNSPPLPTNIPDQLDWRNHGYNSTVKDQGRCGSCWAFGAVASVEAQLFVRYGQTQDLSEQYIVDCTYLGHSGCRGGNPIDAFIHMINRGITTEEAYPYKARSGVCRAKDMQMVLNISAFHEFPPGNENLLQRALAVIGPIVVAFYMPPSMRLYGGGVYNHDIECPHRFFNHVVLLVGYGTTESNEDFWIIKNSFGPTWGDQGYFKLPRGKLFCSMGLFAAFPVLH